MGNKYGIYQSTSKSCVFYKQDDDGNQSTFNIFVAPSKEATDKKEVFAFIDNEQMKKDNWSVSKEAGVKDVVEAFKLPRLRGSTYIIGPGMMDTQKSKETLLEFLKSEEKRQVIIDASALSVMEGDHLQLLKNHNQILWR